MVNRALFSICIPTYNRANYLLASIESIICQKEFLEGAVEIVISDNASTDSTEEVCKRYVDQYSNIYYYKNKTNIGNDNFPLVLSRANGVLRRLCNDTLCFEEGSLQSICEITRNYSEEKPYICWLEHGNEPDIACYDFKNGVKEVSYWFTSIACFSIWDDECINLESDVEGAELRLWQVRKALELVSEKNGLVIVNKKLTHTQMVYQKNISYGLYQVFYQNYFRLLSKYFESGQLDDDAKMFLERDLLISFFPEWCAKWKLQNTSLQYSKSEDLCECIYQQYHDKPYWREYLRKYKKIYWKFKIQGMVKKLRRG